MKSNLTLVPTGQMTREEWLAYRQSGIGASEVACLFGLDDFKSSLELFYQKIGDVPMVDVENIYQFMGREHEDFIARLWQYWEGTEESLIANYRLARVVRKCQRVAAYLRNPRYPWMYVSLDRKINKHGGKDEGALELKNIGGWEMDKWEARIPPKFVIQVQTQLMLPEFDYGELALLEDGRRFHVLPFERSDDIIAEIEVRTKAFWDRVVAGRKLVNEKYDPALQYNQKRLQQIEAEITNLAPEPDGSLAYEKYLAKRFQLATAGERRGSLAELSIARLHARFSARLKELEEQRRHVENEIKSSMGEFTTLEFGAEGRVYWTQGESGRRVFRNKVAPGDDDAPL